MLLRRIGAGLARGAATTFGRNASGVGAVRCAGATMRGAPSLGGSRRFGAGGGPRKSWTLPEVAEKWEEFKEDKSIDDSLGLWGQIKLFSALLAWDVHPHFTG